MVTTKDKILISLLKHFKRDATITTLAKDIGMTSVGAWKAIKKLERSGLLVISSYAEIANPLFK